MFRFLFQASAYVSTTVAPSVATTAAPVINKYVQDVSTDFLITK